MQLCFAAVLRPAPEGAGLFWLLRLPALTRAGLVPCLLAASAAGAAPLHPQAPPGIHGRVQDTAGIPIAGATVRLEDTPFAAVTDAEGRYALDGLGAGRHRLTVHAVGFDTAERRLNVPREGEALRLDLVLARGVPLLEEVVTLVAAAEAPEGGARHVLRRSDLARAGSLPRALARVPGVFVKDYGPGGPRQVSIRGADPQQTLVLWGEERLLAPGGTGFDLATLPLQAIDSIEVIGRGASSRWGEGAAGGVVRIHSSAIEPARGGVASLEGGVGAGSLGARDGALRAALELGGARLGVSASAASYEESFGRAAAAGGDQWAAALGLGLPRLGLSLSTTVQRADRAAPGPVFSP
ncbi:MAG: carboxypeptidase regulatory-like domain-containing protein, partial [Gemmatimonadota bacterium]